MEPRIKNNNNKTIDGLGRKRTMGRLKYSLIDSVMKYLRPLNDHDYFVLKLIIIVN